MTENPETVHYRGKRRPRRLKKWQGSDWTPPTMSADAADGKHCRACGIFHGYMTLGVSYEKRGEAWVLMWSCPKGGNVVGELWLGDTDGGT